MPAVRHGRIGADGVEVFFREAGPADAPVLLLLHRFANSSFYFRHLMPLLADRFRLVAPELSSFGFTGVPDARQYRCAFASVSRTILAFTGAMGLRRYMLYVFDYGVPVGRDLALAHPERIAGIVSQNGNAYEAGLGEQAWAPLRAYRAHPGQGPRDAIRARMTLDGVKAAYVHGMPDPSRIEPEAYTLDAAILARPGNAERQVDPKLDYKRNLERHPLVQAYLRAHRPPLLAIWGRNDSFFVPAGAEAFRRDIPDARSSSWMPDILLSKRMSRPSQARSGISSMRPVRRTGRLVGIVPRRGGRDAAPGRARGSPMGEPPGVGNAVTPSGDDPALDPERNDGAASGDGTDAVICPRLRRTT